ncbi:hypothetical protein N7516_002075 [Penicillium verrucosum]|uniref:uncharacterized protein n=1 Tax=Penicillium verrucosum TaxID=60171 RepID=UPI00254518EB|nr:uncharacterized protein N7516_002075 [Penicillium verrucosum]KAJ5941907.1 hypothetical protein N7516_002075 [Penicillium verrucosum]
MSNLLSAGKLCPWLPKHLGSLHDWLKRVEPTWGFTIYRTIYTPEYDVAFANVVDLMTVYIKDGFYKQYKSLLENPRTADQADEAIFDELWAAYKPRVIDDATHFNSLSIDQLCT